MAAKKRKSNRNNRAGKICISMILVVFAAAMSVQIVKAYQKDQEYARKQEQLEVSFRITSPIHSPRSMWRILRRANWD